MIHFDWLPNLMAFHIRTLTHVHDACTLYINSNIYRYIPIYVYTGT